MAGHWEGHLEDGALKYRLELDLVQEAAGTYRGTAYASTWGETRWELKDFHVEEQQVRFSLADEENGICRFEFTLKGGVMHGTYHWNHQVTPCQVSRFRVEHAAHLDRPQIPKKPYPYKVEDVTFRSGNISIGAGITIPHGGAHRRPAVVILQGSDPGEWRPRIPGRLGDDVWLWVASDSLTRNGYITLRLDSRGFGATGGRYDRATFDDLVADVTAGMSYLRSRDDVAPEHIGILGLSQGGLVALRCAATSSISFAVLVGCPGLPLDEVFLEGSRRIHLATGAKRDQIDAYIAIQRRVFTLAKTDLPAKAIGDLLRAEIPAGRLKDASMDAKTFQKNLDKMLTPNMRSIIRYDPKLDLLRAKARVLILHGENDLFVPAEQSLRVFQALCRVNRLTNVTIHKMAGMSHTLYHTDPSGLRRTDNFTIDPAALHLIHTWLDTQN